jgi:hypothetical protein
VNTARAKINEILKISEKDNESKAEEIGLDSPPKFKSSILGKWGVGSVKLKGNLHKALNSSGSKNILKSRKLFKTLDNETQKPLIKHQHGRTLSNNSVLSKIANKKKLESFKPEANVEIKDIISDLIRRKIEIE